MLYPSLMHGMHFHFIHYTCTQIHGHPPTPLIQSTPTQFDITLTEGTGVEKRLEERGGSEGGIGGERKGWKEGEGRIRGEIRGWAERRWGNGRERRGWEERRERGGN